MRPDDLTAGSVTQEAADDAARAGDQDPESLRGDCPECELVTSAKLGPVFTGATAQELQDLAEGLNYNSTDGKIDTHLRISHFLGQMKEKVGANITLRESLNYSTLSRLQAMFSYFRRGLKQLTGRYNYRQFIAGPTAVWGEVVDLVADPDKVAETKYSARSGLWFRVDRNSYALADGSITRAVSEKSPTRSTSV